MKTFLSISIMFLFLSASAQDRVLVNGEITVPVGEDPDGIAVVNSTAMRATVADNTGRFQMRVAKGDTLNFSSLQFQDFTVIIDEGVVKTRKLHVFISEAVTELPEVVVTPYDLSGNVRVDVQIIPVAEPKLPTKTAAEINPYDHEFRPDSLVSPQNPAMRTGMIYSGANLANIFRHIFTPRNTLTDIDKEENLEEELLQLQGDDFFEEQLNLQEEELKNFVYYVEDHGLTREMLQPENEMQLIEFLVAKSQEFKNSQQPTIDK
ncbi:MAG: hypothetical protein WBL27_05575 [Salinimicrobium sp.]